MRQKKKLKIYGAIRIVLCLLVLFLIVFPFVWLILSTFKLQKDIIKWPPTIWPKAWTIKNYIKVYYLARMLYAGSHITHMKPQFLRLYCVLGQSADTY